jgi:hypothetical protein
MNALLAPLSALRQCVTCFLLICEYGGLITWRLKLFQVHMKAPCRMIT